MRGERYRTYSHMVSLKGIEPPYFATMLDYRADITLKSGRVIHSEYTDVNGHGGVGGMGDGLRYFLAGVVPKEPVNWSSEFFEILNFFPDRYPNEDFSGASVKGALALEIRKAVLVKTAPFRAGVTVDFPRRHYVLRQAAYYASTVHYYIVCTSVKPALRGQESFDWEEFSMLIYNPIVSSRVSGGGNGCDTLDGFFCDVVCPDGDFTLASADWHRINEPAPPDWMDNAKISFFTTEPCGRITLPYEIKDVTLAR
jgi:hypothetical protein